MKITEIPITLHPDGRTKPPHLKSFRDGWRTLRFLLINAPDYLYLIPGGALFIIGVIFQLLLIQGPAFIFGFYFGIHWLALGCLNALIGFQILCMGAFCKAFAINEGYETRGRLFERLINWFTLEAGIVVGVIMIWLGLMADMAILTTWLARNMGHLGSAHAVFVATTLIALGVQVVFSSFFLGMLKLSAESDPRCNVSDP